jgi:hypothetical protein
MSGEKKKPKFTGYDFSVFFTYLLFFVVTPAVLLLAVLWAVNVSVPEANECKDLGGTYTPGRGDFSCRVVDLSKYNGEYVKVGGKP